MREAPAMVIIDGSSQRRAVHAYDPVAANTARASSAIASGCATRATMRSGGRRLAVVTEWNEFRDPDFKNITSAEDAGRVRRP